MRSTLNVLLKFQDDIEATEPEIRSLLNPPKPAQPAKPNSCPPGWSVSSTCCAATTCASRRRKPWTPYRSLPPWATRTAVAAQRPVTGAGQDRGRERHLQQCFDQFFSYQLPEAAQQQAARRAAAKRRRRSMPGADPAELEAADAALQTGGRRRTASTRPAWTWRGDGGRPGAGRTARHSADGDAAQRRPQCPGAGHRPRRGRGRACRRSRCLPRRASSPAASSTNWAKQHIRSAIVDLENRGSACPRRTAGLPRPAAGTGARPRGARVPAARPGPQPAVHGRRAGQGAPQQHRAPLPAPGAGPGAAHGQEARRPPRPQAPGHQARPAQHGQDPAPRHRPRGRAVQPVLEIGASSGRRFSRCATCQARCPPTPSSC